MITLIAFDPDARLGAQEEKTPTPIPASSESTVPPPKAPKTVPSPAPPPLAQRESRLANTALWRLGVAPRAQFGDVGTFGWGVQLEATRTDAARRGAWLMGLDVVTSEVGLLDSSARLFQVGAFGAICPSLVEGGTLFGCGGMEVGALAADTSDSATVEAEPSSIRALVAPTAMLGFQTEVAPGWLFFARGGAAYHLITYDFGVARAGDTTTSAFEQSRVAGRASVGVAHDL